MKIDKSTWHYRLVEKSMCRRYHTNSGHLMIPKSICKYFWEVVFAIFRVYWKWWLIPLYLVFMFFGIRDILISFDIIGGVELVDSSSIILNICGLVGFLTIVAPICLGVAGLMVAATAGICKGIGWVKNRKNGVDKQPNILVEYIKAKKQKICPMIEFVSEDDK